MIKRRSKRLVSILLAALMVVGTFPAAALAEEGNGTTSAAATKLPDAVNGVVTLTEDVTVATLDSNTTYDLNGHTLTYTGNTIKIEEGQALRLIDTSVSGTDRGGTFESTGLQGVKCVFQPLKGATIETSNIKITSPQGSLFYPRGNAAAVNITNCDVSAAVYCVGTNSGDKENAGVVINLSNSTFTSKNQLEGIVVDYMNGDDCAIMLNVPGTLTMKNCKVTADRLPVLVRAGNATIDGCELDLTGEYKGPIETNWGSGNGVASAALVVGSQTSGASAYPANAVCTVTNTTLTSKDNAKPAIYVSGNNNKDTEKNPNNYSSTLTLSNITATGNIVVADSTEKNPSSVVITDNSTVSGDITNNSTASAVAVMNGAKVSGEVTGTGANNVVVEGKDNSNSNVVAVNTTTSKIYTDLATAINEAENGATIKLQKDVSLGATGTSAGSGVLTINKDITLDGNGKTITADSGFSYNASNSRGEYHVIGITNSAKNVTIKNLTIDGKNDATAKTSARSGINIWSNADKINVAVENVTVKNCSTYGLTTTNADVTVNGLTTENNAWGGINVDSKQGAANLTVNAATITEDNSIYFEQSNASADVSATINNGSFQYIRAAQNVEPKLSVKGGTFAPLTEEATKSGALDISNYIPSGMQWNPSTGKVEEEPPYTGKYSYEITTKVGDNGAIKVDRYATEGEKVTITVTPDEAYLLDALTVTSGKKDIDLTDNGDGTYTFTMPSGDVKIDATFAEDPNWEKPTPDPTPSTDVSDIFVDIAPDAWYTDAVQFAYDEGIMTGTSKDTFSPELTTTRGMIVSMLARLEGNPTARDAGFADVADGAWYADAVNWAAGEGIVSGYSDSQFGPNDPITREQMAAILHNYAEYKGMDVSARADLSKYADADSISSWATDVLSWANAEGLVNGMTEDTIAPKEAATRAQVAAIFQRFLSE